MKRRLDLRGKRFGRLVVANEARTPSGRAAWRCACDCGNESVVMTNNLTSGHSQSCGCGNREAIVKTCTTHGEQNGRRKTVEYNTWWGMISRCRYPSVYAYPWYGGKGIKVCDRWLGRDGLSNFIEDMGRRPGDGWSIDRIDSDGDYEPTNCRWLPMSENLARAHAR